MPKRNKEKSKSSISPPKNEREDSLPVTSVSPICSSDIIQLLYNKQTGLSKDYDILIQSLSNPNVEIKQLQQHIQALTNCTSHLTKEFDTLVGTILMLPWVDYDVETVQIFMDFLTHLLSSQTFYLPACLKSILKLFWPVVPLGCPPQNIVLAGQEKRFSYAHEALKIIIQIVPSAPKFLPEIISKHFPYIKKHRVYHECYVKNILRIIDCLPAIRLPILQALMDHLDKIDVEIPKHELEDDEEDDEDTQFEVDMEHLDINGKDDNGEMKNEFAASLDACLFLVFEFLHKTSCPRGQLDLPLASSLFNQLKQVFEAVILPTHASHHVQFIMFYMCSLNQVFVNSFLDFLWKKVINPNTPAILRQATAAYIASFTARAKYIPLRTIKYCLDLMAEWIHSYIDSQDGNIVIPNVERHGPFYSLCQALFYVIVFRHHQLVETSKGIQYLRKLNLERIINCRLNPLKVCLPSVVSTFAAITRRHEIVFCYTIIERNSRSVIPIASSNRSKTISQLTQQNPLDSFFPFDPYLLNRSSCYIKPLYQEWEGMHPEDDVKEDMACDQKCEDDEYMEYGKSPEQSVPMSETATSPLLYGVSPGFRPGTVNNDWKFLHH